MDSVWEITGIDRRSGNTVRSQLIAGSEAEARTMAAAIHIDVTGAQQIETGARSGGPGSAPMRCPHCGAIEVPRSRYQGSRGMSAVLFFVFFPAAILYEVWRHAAKQWVCPSCGRAGMVPRELS